MTEPSPNLNALIRGAYATSRSKSARPLFHDQGNRTPEDVHSRALRAGESMAEADRLARHHAATHGGDFDALLRNDYAKAQGRQRL